MLSAPLPQAESNIFNPQLQQNLQKLITDLHTTSLCNIKDYTGIELDTLNNYLSNTPLNHPIFGKIQSFVTETDGTLVPIRMVVEYRERIAAEIAATLINWSKWTNIGGRVTTAQGAKIYQQKTETGRAKFLIPDVSYISREVNRTVSEEQAWTYGGEPFDVLFVVEIDTLQGIITFV